MICENLYTSMRWRDIIDCYDRLGKYIFLFPPHTKKKRISRRFATVFQTVNDVDDDDHDDNTQTHKYIHTHATPFLNRSMNTSFARVTVAKLSMPFCVVLFFFFLSLFSTEPDKLRNWSMRLRLVAVILPKCLRFFFGRWKPLIW